MALLRNFYFATVIILLINNIKSTASHTPPAATTTPVIIPNINILCDGVDPDTASFETCTAKSDSATSCCFLTTSTKGVTNFSDQIADGSFKYSTTFQTKLCVPLQVSSERYPSIMEISGMSYNVYCPTVSTVATTYDKTNYVFPRGTSCGPERAYSYADCQQFSITGNTCCLSKLIVDIDFEIDTCFFHGAVYNTTLWQRILAQEAIRKEKNDTSLEYIDVNGDYLNASAMSNETLSFFDNYTFSLPNIGYSEIICQSRRIEITIFTFIIFFIYFFILI